MGEVLEQTARVENGLQWDYPVTGSGTHWGPGRTIN